MSIQPRPQKLTLDDLARLCAQETEHYYQHREHDPRFCFELFRRAISDKDQIAWESLAAQYRPMVTGWVRQHPTFESTGEEPEYFVNGAFARIASHLTPDKFAGFSDLGYLLRYLKMCVHSVIVDYSRTVEQAGLQASLDDMDIEARAPGLDVEDEVSEALDNQSLWEWLDSRLNDEKERLVIEGLFVLALKPRELFDRAPTVFTSVDEIYQVKQNVLARLRRDPGAQTFLGANA